MQHTTRYAIVLGITAATAAAEITGSQLTASTGLLSDALHLLGDGIPFILGYLLTKDYLPREEEVHQIVEYLIRILNTVFLVGTAAYMLYRGLHLLYSPIDVHGHMLQFALVGIVGNGAQLYFAWGLHDAHNHAHTYRSQILHLAADLGASVVVVIAAYVVSTTGYDRADSIATLVVALITVYAAWHCIKDLMWNEPHSHGHSHNHEHHH